VRERASAAHGLRPHCDRAGYGLLRRAGRICRRGRDDRGPGREDRARHPGRAGDPVAVRVGLLSVVGDGTLFGVLRGHAERGPDPAWLTFECDNGAARTWSYGEFIAEVEATARSLSELGLGPGVGFLVCLDNHPELIRLVLAAAATGSIAIPADTRLTAR